MEPLPPPMAACAPKSLSIFSPSTTHCVCVFCRYGGVGRLDVFSVGRGSLARVVLTDGLPHSLPGQPLSPGHQVLVRNDNGPDVGWTLTCMDGADVVWAAHVPGTVTSVGGSSVVVVAGCSDGSLVLLCAVSGRMLSAPLSTWEGKKGGDMVGAAALLSPPPDFATCLHAVTCPLCTGLCACCSAGWGSRVPDRGCAPWYGLGTDLCGNHVLLAPGWVEAEARTQGPLRTPWPGQGRPG